jgi:hypothetical protein
MLDSTPRWLRAAAANLTRAAVDVRGTSTTAPMRASAFQEPTPTVDDGLDSPAWYGESPRANFDDDDDTVAGVDDAMNAIQDIVGENDVGHVQGSVLIAFLSVECIPVIANDHMRATIADFTRTSGVAISDIVLGVDRTGPGHAGRLTHSLASCDGCDAKLYPTCKKMLDDILAYQGPQQAQPTSGGAPPMDPAGAAGKDTFQIVVRSVTAALHYTPANFMKAEMDSVALSGSTGLSIQTPATQDHHSASAAHDSVHGRVKLAILSKARRAKTRMAGAAKNPTVHAAQKMHSSLELFADIVTVSYVTDFGMLLDHVEQHRLPDDLHNKASGNVRTASVGTARVDSAIVVVEDGVALSATDRGVRNVQVHVSGVMADFPFRPTAIEVIHPQLADWVKVWKDAMGSPATTAKAAPSSANAAFTASFFTIDVKKIGASVGLPTKARVRVECPRLCTWITSNPEEQRTAVRLHLTAATIFSKTAADEQSLTLPQCFGFVCSDGDNTQVTAMVDYFEARISTDLFSHFVLTYEHILGDIAPMFSRGETAADDDAPSRSPERGASSGTVELTIVSPGAKISLAGSTSDLCLSVGGLKAKGSRCGVQPAEWGARVASVEVGLFDRDDSERRKDTTAASDESAAKADRASARQNTSFVWGLLNFGALVQSVPIPAVDAAGRLRVHCQVDSPTVIVRAGCSEMLDMLRTEFSTGIASARTDIAADRAAVLRNLTRSSRYRQLQYRAHQLRSSVLGASDRAAGSTSTVLIVEVNRFVVVLPAGDATYASLRSMQPTRHVSCARNHTHRLSCFDRSKFLPFCAAKLGVESITLKVLSDTSRVGEAESSTRYSFKTSMTDVRLFVSDGTKIEAGRDFDLSEFLPRRRLLGGIGLLTDWQLAEFARSRNKAAIATVEIVGSCEMRKASLAAGVQITVAAPEVHVSSRMPVLIGLVAQEFDTGGPFPTAAPQSSMSSPADTPASFLSAVDVTVRLMPGSLSLHSFRPQVQPATPSDAALNPSGGKRVTFNVRRKDVAPRDTAAAAQSTLLQLITLPSAMCIAKLTSTVSTDGSTASAEHTRFVVQFEEAVQLHPSIVLLGQEYQYWVEMTRREQLERAQSLVAQIRGFEEYGVSTKSLRPILTTYVDALLPLPRSAMARSLNPAKAVDVDLSPRSSIPAGSHTQSIVRQVSVLPFRLVATAVPASSSVLALFLDPAEGSMEIVSVFRSPSLPVPPAAAAAIPPAVLRRFQRGNKAKVPAAFVYATVERLRLETTSKLEMKAVDVHLPSVQVLASARGDEGVTIVTFDPSSAGAGPEVQLKLPNMSQALTVMEVWLEKLREASDSMAAHMPTKSPIVTAMTQVGNKYLDVIVTSTTIHLDVGVGNRHELRVANLLFSATSQARLEVEDRATVLRLSVADMTMESEGIVSGTSSLPSGLQMRVLHAECDGRPAVELHASVPVLKAHWKERQLKEVLNGEVVGVRLHSTNIKPAKQGCTESDGASTVTLLQVDSVTAGVSTELQGTFTSCLTALTSIVNEQVAVARTKVSPPKPVLNAPPPMEVVRRKPPTGELSVTVTDATITLSPSLSMSIQSEAAPGIVIVLPRTELSFAQIVQAQGGDGQSEVRRALLLQFTSWEVQRATLKRTLILGGRGANTIELVSEQLTDDLQVGYVFALRQAQPWHVSAFVADIEALRSTAVGFSTGADADAAVNADQRVYVPLAPARFAPELRVVGDVGFNIDMLLQWVGVSSGNLVPVLLHAQLCDPLELVLAAIEGGIETFHDSDA